MHISILAHCSPPCTGGEIEEDACVHPMRVSPDTVCFLNASVYECMCVCPASVCVCVDADAVIENALMYTLCSSITTMSCFIWYRQGGGGGGNIEVVINTY